MAGTIAGLKALKADSARRVAEYGGKPAFMLVPGIDVPFHSTLLRKGVPEFRDKLDALLPKHIDYRGRLVGRYIPNLVAVPFEMTKEFAAKILEVVPSERIKAALDDPKVGFLRRGRPEARPSAAHRTAELAVRLPGALDRNPGAAVRFRRTGRPRRGGVRRGGSRQRPTLANPAPRRCACRSSPAVT